MRRQINTVKVHLVLIFMMCSAIIILIHCISSESGVFSLISSKLDCVCCGVIDIEMRKSAIHRGNNDIQDRLKPNNRVCRTSPSSLLEQTRRQIGQTIEDQWLFLKNQIRSLQRLFLSNSTSNISTYQSILRYIIAHGSEYNRVLQFELKKLASVDGWNDWRLKEAKELKEIVQKRLIKLQNPRNCSEAPIVCNLTNPSGFASGAHDVLWCFIKAYKENRRLVLVTSHWHYAANGWETVFLPLSETCHENTQSMDGKNSFWPGENNNKARWIMRTLPQDLGPRIIRLHGDPLAWWYGQFLQYLMRPNTHLSSYLESMVQSINFSAPIVGIHVRRTDKVGSEAKAHELEEYMQHVEEYFQGLETVSLEAIKRRVYIATDDPDVLIECHRKFPAYECLYYNGSAEMASKLETRYSSNSLWSLVIDIFLISRTDYLVCTLSSGVCRLAYELKQALIENLADTSDKVLSLDIPHHYAWVMPAARKAIFNHRPKSSREISFKRGDVLVHKDEYCTVNAALKGKVTNGFIKMTFNQKEILEGFVPIYKTRKMFQLIDFSPSKNEN